MNNDTLAKLAADNVPERIYLVLGEDIAPDDDPRADFDDLADVNWCIDKQFEHDIEYVRADVAALTAQALPAAEPEIWPIVNIDVDEAGAITNAKLYAPGLPAGNHDVYPVRVPYMDEHTEAWQACADEIRAHLPDWREGVNGIEWAVSAIKHLAANQFTGAFTGIAARKLAELASQGYTVNGYSLMHTATRARGFIDAGGFVGWWSNRDHEQAAQALPAAEPVITIDFKQATELLEMFGGEPTEVTLRPGDGHSGRGLYAYYTELPEEGAFYLGVPDDEARPPQAAQQAAQATAGAYLQVYRCKIKSRSQIKKEIPREHQGWWADVSAGQVLNLRQAVQADLDRCNLSGPRSRDPDDYMCETFAHGSLVSKVALEYMNPEQHVFALVAALPQPQPDNLTSKSALKRIEVQAKPQGDA